MMLPPSYMQYSPPWKDGHQAAITLTLFLGSYLNNAWSRGWYNKEGWYNKIVEHRTGSEKFHCDFIAWNSWFL